MRLRRAVHDRVDGLLLEDVLSVRRVVLEGEVAGKEGRQARAWWCAGEADSTDSRLSAAYKASRRTFHTAQHQARAHRHQVCGHHVASDKLEARRGAQGVQGAQRGAGVELVQDDDLVGG